MPRIIVLGGRGFFGATAVSLFRREGLQPLVGSRRPGGDLLIDAESPASIRSTLRSGDVVIDAAGPFQHRSTVLVETALTIGFDVVDISDSLKYALAIQRLAHRINGIGTRVLTSCSSVSSVTAALIRLLGIADPVRISTFLAPATGNTSTAATAMSLFSSLEGPIRVLRNRGLVEMTAFSDKRDFAFPDPVGMARTRLGESADVVTLPLVWPMLRDVDFWVDARRPLLNAALAAAARSRSLRVVARAVQPIGRRIAKQFGARSGGFAVEVEDASGTRAAAGFVHGSHSYLVAVAPAVLAAKAIAAGTFPASGLVSADRHVDPNQLVEYLRRADILYFTRGAAELLDARR